MKLAAKLIIVATTLLLISTVFHAAENPAIEKEIVLPDIVITK